jgi:subtilisin family serine protease
VKSRLLCLLLIPLLLAGLFWPAPPAAAQSTPLKAARQADPFTPSARRALAALAPDQKAAFIITLSDQLAASPAAGQLSPLLAAAAAQPTRRARQQLVIESLQTHAAGQAALLAQASALQAQGQVDGIIPFWIFNGVSLHATPAAIMALAAQPGIARITPDPDPDAPLAPLDSPQQTRPAARFATFGPAAGPAPEPNVALTNAPALWALGYTGQGVVIASLDTGVDATHPDLAASYRGGTDSWFDPYGQNAAPADLNGHGTLTMGLMVGDGASGTSIGMAPGAKWIAAKIFDNTTKYTDTAVHQAMQWVINPNNDPANPGAPDVVNNSWGYALGGDCDLTFQPDLLALVAAGIVPVFSAGNSGPFQPSDVSPANNAGAFAVGAIDNNSLIATFSSRGPSSCTPNNPSPYVVAPGVMLRSSVPDGLYSTCTGTSCAAPEVTGGIALLLSAVPHLSLDLQEQAVGQGAADLGDPGYDTTYGYGRLDVQGAYNWLTGPQKLLVTPAFLAASAVSPAQIDLSWRDNNLANASGYEVERSPDGLTGWTALTITAQGAVAFSDSSGLSEGTTYYYRVRAVNATLSTASGYAAAQATTPLLAPATLTATAVSPTGIDLSWSNTSALASGMEIQRSPDGVTNWTTLAANAPGTTFSDTSGLSEGTAYFYLVRAVNPALGAAANSAYVSAGAATLLYAPILYASPISHTEIDLYWRNFSAYATGFELQRSPDGLTGWTTIASLPLDVTRYADTPLIPLSVYYYQVRVLGPLANSAYSAPRAITTSPYVYHYPLILRKLN